MALLFITRIGKTETEKRNKLYPNGNIIDDMGSSAESWSSMTPPQAGELSALNYQYPVGFVKVLLRAAASTFIHFHLND